jgi:hypothetical protein
MEMRIPLYLLIGTKVFKDLATPTFMVVGYVENGLP